MIAIQILSWWPSFFGHSRKRLSAASAGDRCHISARNLAPPGLTDLTDWEANKNDHLSFCSILGLGLVIGLIRYCTDLLIQYLISDVAPRPA